METVGAGVGFVVGAAEGCTVASDGAAVGEGVAAVGAAEGAAEGDGIKTDGANVGAVEVYTGDDVMIVGTGVGMVVGATVSVTTTGMVPADGDAVDATVGLSVVFVATYSTGIGGCGELIAVSRDVVGVFASSRCRVSVLLVSYLGCVLCGRPDASMTLEDE